MPIIWLRWRRVFFRKLVAAEEAGHVRNLHRRMTSWAHLLVPAGQHRSDRRRDGRRRRGRSRRRHWRGHWDFLVLPSATESEDDEDEEHDGDEDRRDEGNRGLSRQGTPLGRGRG